MDETQKAVEAKLLKEITESPCPILRSSLIQDYDLFAKSVLKFQDIKFRATPRR